MVSPHTHDANGTSVRTRTIDIQKIQAPTEEC